MPATRRTQVSRCQIVPALPRRHPALYLAIICLISYGLLVGVPLARGVPDWLASYGGSLVFAVVSLCVVGFGVTWRLRPVQDILGAVVCLGLWISATQIKHVPDAMRLHLGAAASVVFLLACLFAGKVLSRIVRERAMTLPVCIVAALADIFTVFWGPTGTALEKAPKLVEKLSLAIPAAGSAAGPEGVKGLALVATMGLGDFIFLALFLSLAVRFGFPVARTFWSVVVAALVGIILAQAAPLDLPGMPLLPYMSIGFIVANRGNFWLSGQERRDLAIALGVLVVMFAVAALALR